MIIAYSLRRSWNFAMPQSTRTSLLFKATLFTLPLLSVAFGQDITAKIGGSITDPSVAPISGASVTATNLDTNQATTGKSNQDGYYELLYLKPGPYQLKASYTGFKTSFRQSVTLQVGGRVRIDFPLEVGDAATSVVITA